MTVTAHRSRLEARHRQAVEALDAAQQELSRELLRPGRDPLALRAACVRVREADLRVLALDNALVALDGEGRP
jgi:hypothetical protein